MGNLMQMDLIKKRTILEAPGKTVQKPDEQRSTER